MFFFFEGITFCVPPAGLRPSTSPRLERELGEERSEDGQPKAEELKLSLCVQHFICFFNPKRLMRRAVPATPVWFPQDSTFEEREGC